MVSAPVAVADDGPVSSTTASDSDPAPASDPAPDPDPTSDPASAATTDPASSSSSDLAPVSNPTSGTSGSSGSTGSDTSTGSGSTTAPADEPATSAGSGATDQKADQKTDQNSDPTSEQEAGNDGTSGGAGTQPANDGSAGFTDNATGITGSTDTSPGSSTTEQPTAFAALSAASARDTAAAATPEQAAVIQADYGLQKYRVGVKVKSGAYVPPGTTTAGSVIRVTETYAAGDPQSPNVFTCTTVAPTVAAPGDTTTYCSTSEGTPVDPATYEAAPGSTVTFQQLTAAPGLVVDPQIRTLQPCQATPIFPSGPAFCFVPTDIVFEDNGLPPLARDDAAAKPRKQRRVVVMVLANDDPRAPLTGLKVTRNPGHGTATVVDGQVAYIPRRGFHGTDTFTYTITTANGSSTATVTVRVPRSGHASVTSQPSKASQASPPASTASVAPSAATLPSTGGPDGLLAGLGGLLLLGGSGLAVGSRRRRSGAGAIVG